MYFVDVRFVGLLRIVDRMNLFENRVLGKTFGPNRNEVTMGIEKTTERGTLYYIILNKSFRWSNQEE